ncbi:MAG: hypothetical protein JWP45_1029, partial [Mucilaginibacter sp.]|nr:hypothetical protein [Mucilaginibacter sp.]
MGSHFVSFTFFTARHNTNFLICYLIF